MALTTEQMVETMHFMAEQISKLTAGLAEAKSRERAQQDHRWDSSDKFKNLKQFAGYPKDWEEFSTKFRSQVGAGCDKAAQTLECSDTTLRMGLPTKSWMKPA